MYGCETWTLYRSHLRKLEQFHTHSMRSIMQIPWQDRVLNQEILQRASTTSIETMVHKAQLRWTGHVIRMAESRIPRQLFYGELSQGRRSQGQPKTIYKDNLKSNPYLSTSGVPKSGDVSKSSRCKNAFYDNVRILSENHPKAFRKFPMCFTTMSECSPRIPRRLSEFSRHLSVEQYQRF